MKNEHEPTDFTRQADIVAPEDLEIPITVIGAGGIGSFAVDALAKMGCTCITVFDHDVVEAHNVPNQRYGPGSVDVPKVCALRDFVRANSGVEIRAIQRVWVGNGENEVFRGIVISAVDSMEVRKKIWKKVKFNPAVRLFIDGRIGGEYSEVYALAPADPDNVKFYAKTLFKDKHAADLPCTAQAVIYVGYGVAMRIASIVRLFVKGLEYPPVIRDDYRNVTLQTC